MSSITLPGLQQHRILAGLSQRQVAKAAGVSYQTIHRIEAGGNAAEITLGVLAKIANALCIPLTTLLAEPEALPADTTTRATVTIAQARLLRSIATKPTAMTTLSKEERKLILPSLLQAGWVSAVAGTLTLHPDTAESLIA